MQSAGKLVFKKLKYLALYVITGEGNEHQTLSGILGKIEGAKRTIALLRKGRRKRPMAEEESIWRLLATLREYGLKWPWKLN